MTYNKIMNPSSYYFLSFTWGIIMTFLGCLFSGVLIIFGKRPQKIGYGWYFEIGERWGGISFGPAAFVQKGASEHLRKHEYGHSLQNCYLGPLFILFVAIPSIIRYWYLENLKRTYTTIPIPAYDSIWFEGTATYLGDYYLNRNLII